MDIAICVPKLIGGVSLLPLTNNIDRNTVHRSHFSSGGCAGVGAIVTRVESSSGNHCISSATKDTANTGG